MYYLYQNDRITGKSEAPPETGNYCISSTDFDLDNTDVIVGLVDANRNLTYYTVKPKPVETLLKNIKFYKQNSEQQIAALQSVTNTQPIDKTTLEGTKESKLRDISNDCHNTIYSGTDITTSQGTEHFSLTDNDQINISNLMSKIQAGATGVPYHADGKLCRMFTADEMGTIYNAVVSFIAYNTTLCNHLNVWINRCTTIDEVNTITYTSPLPDDLKANMDTIIATMSTTPNTPT